MLWQKIKNFTEKYCDEIFVYSGFILAAYLLWDLFVPGQGIFIHGHESEHILVRADIFLEGIRNGNWWPIWTESFFSGFGYPFLLFYGKGMYFLIAMLAIFSGETVIEATQYALWVINLACLWGAYLFLRHYVQKIPAFCGAIIFTFFPYHMADIFMRMDIPELMAGGAIVTFALWALVHVIRTGSWIYGAVFALALAAMCNTHILSCVIWAPFIAIFGLAEILYTKAWKRIPLLVFFAVLSAGISAAYLLPLGFEKSLVQTERLFGGIYEPWRHIQPTIFSLKYPDIDQITKGAHTFTKMYPLTIAIVGLLVAAIFQLIFPKEKHVKSKSALLWCVISGLIVSFFIAMPSAAQYWQSIPGAFVLQFSWRLLLVLALVAAIAAAYIAQSWTAQKYYSRVFVIGIFSSVIWVSCFPYLEGTNWSHWTEYPSPNRDGQYNKAYYAVGDLHGRAKQDPLYTSDVEKEYLPKTVAESFGDQILSGRKAEIQKLHTKTPEKLENISFEYIAETHYRYKFEAKENQQVWIDQFYFPGWKYKINGRNFENTEVSEEGLVTFSVKPGTYEVDVKLGDSMLRAWGKLISKISLLTTALIILINILVKSSWARSYISKFTSQKTPKKNPRKNIRRKTRTTKKSK